MVGLSSNGNSGRGWTSKTLQTFIFEEGARLYRNLPWRQTFDPYAVWISETMLQQTQVHRVDGRWQRWLLDFPSLPELATASQMTVLTAWQGLGYNRRALNVHRAAKICVAEHAGCLPNSEKALLKLPGIGAATAAGIRIFAYEEPALYLETNVRATLLYYLFPDVPCVPDKELMIALASIQPVNRNRLRTFYYALLDIGAHLKRTQPNPSRRSATHIKQSRYEGSHRQKRAIILRILLAIPSGLSTADVVEILGEHELRSHRARPSAQEVCDILEELTCEGFLEKIRLSREHNKVAWKCKETT